MLVLEQNQYKTVSKILVFASLSQKANQIIICAPLAVMICLGAINCAWWRRVPMSAHQLCRCLAERCVDVTLKEGSIRTNL